ncbi:DUF4397 domain-containing protein [Cellulosilyticum sp. I15G10I2]|uniref:DUF4397 domain-containing protein n=1 Tax=Cellulosilyticum sp. I15G10I2 TaxID=1892843 RepID=UPI00085BE56A|nr:DUF4397 domain-containing protein [Cellulosilyticum sp. I15G10I2]
MLKKENIPLSYMRFFHALPIKYSIDIYIDTKLAFRDVLYEDFTDYIALYPGEHTITIKQTKNPITVFSMVWHVPNQKIYTGIIAPKTKDGMGIEIYKIEDITRPIPSNNFLVRIGHFSMPTPTIDIFLSDNTATFKKVSCNELTNYTPSKPGIHTLEIKESTTGKSLLSVPSIRLKTTRFYSIYVIGNNSKEFPLTITIPLDGNSYLRI